MASREKKEPTFLSSVSWSFIDNISLFFINLVISAVLARLIAPSEFGLLAMVSVFTGFLGILKDFGINASLIYKQNLSRNEIDSVFWFNILLSVFLGAIIIFSAPLIGKFYNNPRLINITIAMGFLFIINTLSGTPNALIQKKLLFKEFFFRNISNKILYGLTGIILALKGFGVWALIIGNLVSSIYLILISFKLAGWVPRFYFNKKLLIPHIKYSLPLLGLKVLNYWSGNTDTLLVGKNFGETILGYYNKAYSLMLLPVSKISTSISRVIFPAFSRLQQNKDILWKKYITLINTTAYITFPLMGLMFLLADVIILTVYGRNWLPAVEYFRYFSMIGAINSLTYTGTIFQTIGKTKKIFYLNILLKLTVIAGIIIGLKIGNIKGVIFGYTLGSLIAFVINTHVLSKEFGRSFKSIISALWKEFSVNIVIITGIYYLFYLFPLKNLLSKFIIITGIYGFMYFIFSNLFQLNGYKYIMHRIIKK